MAFSRGNPVSHGKAIWAEQSAEWLEQGAQGKSSKDKIKRGVKSWKLCDFLWKNAL